MAIIEVAIGLSFVFLVFSFIATAIIDGLAEWRQWRARLLYDRIQTLLGDTLAADFYNERRVADLADGFADPDDPDTEEAFSIQAQVLAEEKRIRLRKLAEAAGEPSTPPDSGPTEIPGNRPAPGRGSVARTRRGFTRTARAAANELAKRMGVRRLPASIPGSVFADVVMDWLEGRSLPARFSPEAPTPLPIPFPLAELWQRMNIKAGGDPAALRAEVESWFEQTMERTSADFKRKIRKVLIGVGLLIALLVNVDAIRISSELYANPEIRASLVASAEEVVRDCPDGVANCEVFREQVRDRIDTALEEGTGRLIGWRDFAHFRETNWLWAPLGFLITALAISLGADFWFGLLKRILSIRQAAGAPTEPASRPAESGQSPATEAAPALESAVPVDILSTETAPLKGFQPLSRVESLAHAFWLAQFSALAYNPPEEIGSSGLLARHGLDMDFIQGGDSQVYVFTDATRCIVAFRGTEKTPDDWVTDVKAAHHAAPWGVVDERICLHRGFLLALDAIWPQLRARLAATQCPVWFTGHSLGGALAVLAAYRLSRCEPDMRTTIGGVYTFGQPRVGNGAFAAHFDPELAQRVFRYVNFSDIVPLVPPPKPLDYEHLGHARYFDSVGRLHVQRTLWERVAEQLSPALRDIGQPDADWKRIALDHLRRRISDHAMAKYIQHLEGTEQVIRLFRATPAP